MLKLWKKILKILHLHNTFLINMDMEWNMKKIKCWEHTFNFQVWNNIIVVWVF